MSLWGIGHFRRYSDAQWEKVKPALEAAGIDTGTGVLFSNTQHAISIFLQNNTLVEAAEKAIDDVSAKDVPLTERLATAAKDVIPVFIDWYKSGGIEKTEGDVATLVTTFTQEVYNIKRSTSIAQAISDAEAVISKLS